MVKFKLNFRSLIGLQRIPVQKLADYIDHPNYKLRSRFAVTIRNTSVLPNFIYFTKDSDALVMDENISFFGTIDKLGKKRVFVDSGDEKKYITKSLGKTNGEMLIIFHQKPVSSGKNQIYLPEFVFWND